jgi:signal transduction histidine kinase
MKFSGQISPIINDILNEARKLVVSYQRTVDEEMRKSTRDAARRDQLSLILFYLSLFFGCLFLLLNVRSNFKNYRVAGEFLEAEQKRLDKTLQELQLARSTVTELQNVNDAKNAFIATVNHELRTPLTSIIGYIDIIREEEAGKSSTGLNQYLDVLDRNAQILLNLVESMLTLSKIDSNKGQPALERVWLNEVIDNSIFTIKPLAINSGITINLDAKDDFYVVGDGGQLTQVFINLLGNAVKFSPRESTIKVSVDSLTDATGQSMARISVADSGIGIPAEDMEYLFTRFFRAHNAVSEHFQGTGLGLSIVSQVIESHNGRINVQSKEGVGTTFTVDIPLHMNSEEKMIHDRRGDVLNRAIASLEGCSPETVKAVTHDIGGALGFYGFADIGANLLEYSRTLSNEEPPAKESFEESRKNFLTQLRLEAKNLSGVEHG